MKPVGVAVRHRGVVELRAQLLGGDVSDDRDVAVADAGVGVLGQRSQHRLAVPGVADDAAENVALALHDLQRRIELALVEQHPFIFDAGIGHHALALLHGVDRIADGMQDAFARTHAAVDALQSPGGIGRVEDEANAIGRKALACLRRVPHQQQEQDGEVLVVLDLVIRPAADGVAEVDEILQQQRHRVGLGLR